MLGNRRSKQFFIWNKLYSQPFRVRFMCTQFGWLDILVFPNIIPLTDEDAISCLHQSRL